MRERRLHVLVAGGGVAALEAALALDALARDLVDVELLTAERTFAYRPLAVAEPFGRGAVHGFDLAELTAAAGARLTPGELVAVNPDERVARTADGAERSYDVLVVAVGALARDAVPGAFTFRGPVDTAPMAAHVERIRAGEVGRVVVTIPWGSAWVLPAYELALLAAADGAGAGAEVTLATPESEPLELFGADASAAVRTLLEERGVELRTRAAPIEVRGGALRLAPDGRVDADLVVALPRLAGPTIGGLPQTLHGFLAVDEHGRLVGVPDVFAAGDVTSFPVKQGGIAAQQADAAAEAIAEEAGALLTPAPFRPILRGLLLTGSEPRFLRRELGEDGPGAVGAEPLWWPPAKIVGRHLAPFLAERGAGGLAPPAAAEGAAVAVDVELRPAAVERLRAARLAPPGPRAPEPEDEVDERAETVADVMETDLLLVAPEDTLGEVSERLEERGGGSALVWDGSRLIGILTTRDLIRALAGRAHPAEARVRAWMTTEPLVVPPGTPLADAAALMAGHRVHHLPVVEAGRPVGVVGARSVARAGARARAGRADGIGLGF